MAVTSGARPRGSLRGRDAATPDRPAATRAGRRTPVPDTPPSHRPGTVIATAPGLELLSDEVAADLLADRDVLVVGINYAPEPTGIAPYTAGLCEHLQTRARSVTVLTGVPHYPSWDVEPYYLHGLRYRERGDATTPDLIRLRHHVPHRQSALRRAGYEGSFLVNALSTPLPCRPDLVVAVTPSLGGAVAGAVLARRHGVPLLVVVQDLMAAAAAQSGIEGGGRVSGVTGRIEGWALRRADRVAVVSRAFESVVRRYGVPADRIGLLPNWSHIDGPTTDRREARRRLGWPDDRFIVAHTGNMGLKQDLGNVVDAARALPDDALVMLVGDGSQRAAVEALAVDVPAVRFVDPLDAEEYPLALAAADVLLVNERPSVGDMSLPSKLTSYFLAGRPVVAAVSPTGATAAELAATDGAAVAVTPGDPAALAQALTELRDDPELRDGMADAARAYAEAHLTARQAMARFDTIVDATLAG